MKLTKLIYKYLIMKFNLSEITELIKNRRTIYPEQFSTRKIHKEQIELLLNNAIWAPTHGNTQPWKFTVFTEKSKVDLSDFLADLYLKKTPKELHDDKKLSKFLTRPQLASVVIAVSLKRDPTHKIKEVEEIEAVACAIQNILLSATAYGIGSFWSTPKFIYEKETNEFLGLNEEDKCLGIIYLGYPLIQWPQQHRKPIEYNTEWR
jgi:nitroreductase